MNTYMAFLKSKDKIISILKLKKYAFFSHFILIFAKIKLFSLFRPTRRQLVFRLFISPFAFYQALD